MDNHISRLIINLIEKSKEEFTPDEIADIIYTAEINANSLFKQNLLQGIEIVFRHIIMALSKQKRAQRLRDFQTYDLGRKRPEPTAQARRDIKTLQDAKNLFARYGIKSESLPTIEVIDDFIIDLQRFVDKKNTKKIQVKHYEYRTAIEGGLIKEAINNELKDYSMKLKSQRAIGTLLRQLSLA